MLRVQSTDTNNSEDSNFNATEGKDAEKKINTYTNQANRCKTNIFE